MSEAISFQSWNFLVLQNFILNVFMWIPVDSDSIIGGEFVFLAFTVIRRYTGKKMFERMNDNRRTFFRSKLVPIIDNDCFLVPYNRFGTRLYVSWKMVKPNIIFRVRALYRFWKCGSWDSSSARYFTQLIFSPLETYRIFSFLKMFSMSAPFLCE